MSSTAIKWRRCAKIVTTNSHVSKKSDRHPRNRKSSKVVPLDVSIEMVQQKDTNCDVFHFLFNVASVMGLPLAPSMLSMQNYVPRIWKAWSTFVSMVRTVLYVLFVRYHYHLYSSPSVRYCTLIIVSTGFLIMWYLAFKKQEIASSIRDVIELSQQINFELFSRGFREHFKICFYGSFLLVAIYASSAMYFFQFVAYDIFAANIKEFVPFSPTSMLYNFYNRLVIFSMVFGYQISMLTLFLGLFVCCAVYNSATQLIFFYQTTLAKGIEEKPLTDITLSENMIFFKNMVRVITKGEKAISFIALIIYIAVITNSFASVGLILTLDTRLSSPIVNGLNAMIIMITLTLFFYLTLISDAIASQYNLLKMSLLELSDIVVRRARNRLIIVKYELLSWNIRAVQLYGTGFDLFDIDKKVILPFFGVLISYGALLNDVGGNK